MGKNSKYILLLFKAFGHTELFKKNFKKNKPKAVIFTNDHTPIMRSFILACKELHIQTVYVQHAAVSKFFPPLIFDLALLDGKVSEDIYKSIGPTNCKIEFIGIPKLDSAILNNRVRNSVKKIGLAVNQNDDANTVNEVINSLLLNGYEVIFRKHPLDQRKFLLDKDIHDGNSMSLYEFIYYADFLIACDSSIHLEANSLLCRSAYFRLHDSKSYDYYGFVRNGLIHEIKNLSAMVKYLKEFNYVAFDFKTPEIRYYNASVGEEFYGYSGKLAKDLLMRFNLKRQDCLL